MTTQAIDDFEDEEYHNFGGASVPGVKWKMATAVWMFIAINLVFLYVGPVQGFMFPDGARLILFHVPCAWLATVCYVVGAVYAIKFLTGATKLDSRMREMTDFKVAASMELGLLFSILTTITGSIFAKLQWGMYWNWDPRETSIIIICSLFAAYVVLRSAITDPDKRARLCSAYALVAIIPGLFLIWVLPRIVETLHEGANNAIVGGGLGGGYRLVMYLFVMPAYIGTFVWLFQLRVRSARLIEGRFS